MHITLFDTAHIIKDVRKIKSKEGDFYSLTLRVVDTDLNIVELSILSTDKSALKILPKTAKLK